MSPQDPLDPSAVAAAYDAKAEEYDWRGPEIAFGLSFGFVNAGESLLDIGIGTGLSSILFHKAGLHVYGMDISTEMLQACHSKGFATELIKHDLTVLPYPFATASLDHAVCVGVLNFFKDLQPVFTEVRRILRDGGVFVFAVGDRAPGEETLVMTGQQQTQSDTTVSMFCHSAELVKCLLDKSDFELRKSLEFPVPMDRDRAEVLRAKAYVAQRKRRR